MQKVKVAIFGDSVFRGVVLQPESKKYVFSKDIDWAGIENELDVKIENFSRMGATITHGLNTLNKRLSEGCSFEYAVIEFGGNDSDYDWLDVSANKNKQHKPRTSRAQFEETLNQMIDILEERGVHVILSTIPPISSSKFYNFLVSKGLNEENLMAVIMDVETISRHQEMYNNIIIKTAYRRKIELVDVRREFLKKHDCMTLMCEDGIHPNSEGGKVIVDLFLKRYKRLGGQEGEGRQQSL